MLSLRSALSLFLIIALSFIPSVEKALMAKNVEWAVDCGSQTQQKSILGFVLAAVLFFEPFSFFRILASPVGALPTIPLPVKPTLPKSNTPEIVIFI